MAEITSGNSGGAKKIDRKKDLYNHVSFSDLYAYNPVITNIIELSKKPFSQYIQEAINFWDKEIENCGILDVDFTHGTALSAESQNGIHIAPIELRQDLLADDSGTTPSKIYSSIMEAVDPYDIIFEPERPDDLYSVMTVERIREFIKLGLYPIVTQPISEKEMYAAFEKHEAIAPERETIGIIIRAYVAQRKVGGNSGVPHVYFIVLWDPYFAADTTEELFNSKAGYLTMRDMVPTPEVWKSNTEQPLYLNFGVPMYEYTPYRMMLSNITHVDQFASFINEAVVTGHLELDFVRSILDKLNESANMAMRVAEAAAESSIILDSTKHKLPSDDTDDGVPVIDAKKEDTFGHRLHLYDTPSRISDYDEEDDPFMWNM